MTKDFVVSTSKHQTRFITCMLWFVICTFLTGLGIFALTRKFKLEYLLVEAVVMIGMIYYGRYVWAYFTGKKIFIHIKSDGNILTFSCKTGLDELIREQKLTMDDVSRIYIKEYRRKLMKDKNLIFAKANGTIISEIELYPEVYDCSENNWNEILLYIQQSYPQIQIGYQT